MVQVGDFRLYDIKEASSLLGVSYETIRKYINTGKIKAKKLGLKYMITEKALKNYFDDVA